MSTTVAEQWKQYDLANVCFIVACIAFAWPVVPAVGLGYSGYSTRKSLASFLPAVFSVAVVSVQWWAIGYTLAYGGDSNGWLYGFVGDFSYIFHRGVLAEPIGAIPALLFSEFQLVFCATVCAITVGGFCERGRILPMIPFIFLWSTFIYCPLAHMVWGGGFLEELGSMDFAGGGPVHICSGASATAISVYLSWPQFRSKTSEVRTPSHLKLHRPHNTMSQLLALVLIWSCWLSFEAGTALELNFKAVIALFTTNMCASSGAITWAMMTYYETGKWSLDSTFLGALAGLVFITPAGGFIDVPTSVLFGILGALVGRMSLRIKFTKLAERLRWVDNGDTFATHCIGGFCGAVLTGVFGKKEVAA